MDSDIQGLSGKHLENFARYIEALGNRHSEREKALLDMRDAPEKPEHYVQDILDAGRFADLYAHLSQQIRHIQASGDPSLNGQQLLDFINNFRGEETQPKPLSAESDPMGAFASLQDKIGKQFFEASLQGMEPIKLEAREYAAKAFLSLYHVQENKVDEWICKDILKKDADPALCTRGILNTTELKKTLALPEDAQAECVTNAANYLFALSAYEQRVLPGGPMDVYEKAVVQYKRAIFEETVNRAYPQGTLNTLPLLQEMLLAKAAQHYGLDLKKLQRSIDF